MNKKYTSLDKYLRTQLKNSSFKHKWEESEVQYQLVRQLIKARMSQQISQRKLAQKAKTTQAVISRIESFSVNPSIGLVDKLAQALGKRLSIKLV
jgi:ribosome-binding protein aMBF1 (putative translation factor)